MPRTGRGDPRTYGFGEGELPRPLAQHPIREQEQYLPIANVIRIMRRILPSHAKISDDAKETIQECVSEYISFVTGEANDRCQREQRKTITAEDVLWAMGKLGFDDYASPLSLYLHRYREIETDRGSSLRCEVPSFLRQAAAADFCHGVIGMASYNLNDGNSSASTGHLPFGSINYYAPPMAGEYYGDGSGSSVPALNVTSASVSTSQDGCFADLVPHAEFN